MEQKSIFRWFCARLIHTAANTAAAVKLPLASCLPIVYLQRVYERRAKIQMLLNCFANSPPGLLLPVLKMQKKKPPAKHFLLLLFVFIFKTHGRCCVKKLYIN